ncbi:DUF4363 family protein [Aceticella autotrophica]|uniref:DUF4363 family protein n=1 Tax=Aceticella autotrophica TaxID=2755338 RepID=A0A975GA89_9THEO|nr:DUF4363 family protein [Aceticella autotrophica]QSZ26892.1 DUF4363 family protein [Aceticella autotrophica]
MKYVLPLITIIVALIILIDIAAYNYLNTTSQNFNNTIIKIEKDVNNGKWDSAKNKIEKLDKTWNKINSKWAILIEHNEIDEIDITLAKLKSYIYTNNKNFSLAELKTLNEKFKHIPVSEKLILENIL